MKTIVVSIVVLYMLFMLFIGRYSSKKISSNEDFMLAGRRLGPILMAGTLAATEIGGGSSLGVVEKAFGDWGIDASWYVTTMGIAFIILAFLAPRFRQVEVKTVPEYFRRRYGKTSGLITSIIMILPLIGLTASQFIASSTIVSVMLGWDYKLAVTVVALVVTVYSVLGGLWSVTMTDFIQVFLIVIGMIIAVPFALNEAGGFDMVKANVPAESFKMFNGVGIVEIISLVIMYVASFSVGQEAVSRYYAARDPKAAIQGSVISAIINFIYAFIPTILGIITLSLINMGKLDQAVILENGAYYALPHLAMNTMPAIIVGLLFAGIISATMSSADSDLLGAGSIFANDIYKIYINKEADSKKIMKTTQITMVLIGIFGWLIAFTNTSSIISILMFSFSLRAAGSFLPYIFGLYWEGSSEAGTIGSLIGGSAVVLAFQYIPSLAEFSAKYKLNSIIPALIVSLLVFVIFSKIFPPKRRTTELVSEE
ncbi:MAG: sodium:solute symporter family protein [Anaerococcus sp.]|nr:sodium:solute symporter family protein [Peptoniphilaceae bacterium]MDY3054801.1 sodium:solute symporter family protein [Anaerococcus sp.]